MMEPSDAFTDWLERSSGDVEDLEQAKKQIESFKEWLEHCKKYATRLDPASIKVVYYEETRTLQPILMEINELGFLTMSSQPTSNPQNPIGELTWQLAYVSGYLPSIMAERLFLTLQKEAPECIVYRSEKDAMIVSCQGDHMQYSWSGLMMDTSYFELNKFNKLDLVPFHVNDTAWDRESLHIFEKVKSASLKIKNDAFI